MGADFEEYSKVQVWIHSQGQVLVFKTNPERGGFWQPVTGKVEDNESIEGAALREAKEESGLKFAAPLEDLDFDFRFTGKWGPAHEFVYALQAPIAPTNPPAVRLDPKEHVEARWVSPEQAMTLIEFEMNREGLKRLVKRWGLH